MYSQVDYFQIDRLKEMAEEYIPESYQDWPDRRSFEETIEEVYIYTPESDQGIRDIVVEILDYEFLKRLPAFAADFSIPLMKKFGRYY
jgi:hypothetical protein